MDKNKVQFNLKNVHYSVLSITEGKPEVDDIIASAIPYVFNFDFPGYVSFPIEINICNANLLSSCLNLD